MSEETPEEAKPVDQPPPKKVGFDLATKESIQDANGTARVSEYDMFTFETRMRESIQEALAPYF